MGSAVRRGSLLEAESAPTLQRSDEAREIRGGGLQERDAPRECNELDRTCSLPAVDRRLRSEIVLPRSMRLSLVAAQLVGFLTLLRSVAFDRWITVVMSLLLIAGATAALRQRTWGVGLALTAACWFPVAFAIGIAPAWFCLVGLVGALPFALVSRALARFDSQATALLAALAAVFGVIGAVTWKQVAFSLFEVFPSLTPTVVPNHGLALVALVAGAVLARRRSLANDESGEGSRVRVAQPVRVHTERDLELELEAESDALLDVRRSGRA
jgi:hypothetical protein